MSCKSRLVAVDNFSISFGQNNAILIDSLSELILSVINSDGSCSSRLGGLTCLKMFIVQLSARSPEFSLRQSAILGFINACTLVPATMFDEIDNGVCDLAFDVLKISIEEFSKPNKKIPSFTLTTCTQLITLLCNHRKRFRERAFELLSELIALNNEDVFVRMEDGSLEYTAELVKVSENLANVLQTQIPADTFCNHLEALFLLDNLNPSLFRIERSRRSLFFDQMFLVHDRGIPLSSWAAIRCRIFPHQKHEALKLRIMDFLFQFKLSEYVDSLINELISATESVRRHACDLLLKLKHREFKLNTSKIDAICTRISPDPSLPPPVFSLISLSNESKIELLTVNRLECFNYINELFNVSSPENPTANKEHAAQMAKYYIDVMYYIGDCKRVVVDLIQSLGSKMIGFRLFEDLKVSFLRLIIIPLLINDETINDLCYIDFALDLVRYSENVRNYFISDPAIILRIMTIAPRAPDGTVNKVPGYKIGIAVTYEIAQFENEHKDWFLASDVLLQNFRILWTAKVPDTLFWCIANCNSLDEPCPIQWTSLANLNSTIQLCWLVIRMFKSNPLDFDLLKSLCLVCYDECNYFACGDLLMDFFSTLLECPIEWVHQLFMNLVQPDLGENIVRWLRLISCTIRCALRPCLKSAFGRNLSDDGMNALINDESLISNFIANVLTVLSEKETECTEMPEYYNCRLQCLRLCALLVENMHPHISADHVQEIRQFAELGLNTELHDPADVFESRCVLIQVFIMNPSELLREAQQMYSDMMSENATQWATAELSLLDLLVLRIFSVESPNKEMISATIADCLLRGINSPIHKQNILQHILKHDRFYYTFRHKITVSLISGCVTISNGYQSKPEFALDIALTTLSMILDWEEKEPFMSEIASDSFTLSLYRLLLLFKSIKDIDCVEHARSVVNLLAKACKMKVADNVTMRANDVLYTSLLAVPDEPTRSQLATMSVVIGCVYNLWVHFDTLAFVNLDYPITRLLKQIPCSVLTQPRTKMFFSLAMRKLLSLPMNAVVQTRLFRFLMEEMVVKSLALPESLMESDPDRIVRTMECFDLVCSHAYNCGELQLVLAYVPPDDVYPSVAPNDLNSTPSTTNRSLNLVDLCIQVMALMTREIFQTTTTPQARGVLTHCLTVGIVSVRPYAACLPPDRRKSLLCSVILPVIDKSTDHNLLLVIADTFKMWTCMNELEYGEYQLLIREKMAILSRFIKAIDRGRSSHPSILTTILAGIDGLIAACPPRENEHAKRMEDAVLSALKEPIIFSQAFAHLNAKVGLNVYDRLVFIFSMVHWVGVGTNTYWIGIAMKLLLSCVVPDSNFEIMSTSEKNKETTDEEESTSFGTNDNDDEDFIRFSIAVEYLDGADVIDAIGTMAATCDHPLSRDLAHNLWVFTYQQFIRKLTDDQRLEIDKLLTPFILNEDHTCHMYDGPTTIMQTILEALMPLYFEDKTCVDAFAIQMAAKSYSTWYESLLLLEHRLSSIDSTILDLPDTLVNTQIIEPEISTDLRILHSYYQKIFVLNGMMNVTDLLGEKLYMSAICFNRSTTHVLRDAILMDAIGEYTSAVSLYSSMLAEMFALQSSPPPRISDEDGLALFECKYTNRKLIECLAQLGQWHSVNTLASDQTDWRLDASWRLPVKDFNIVSSKMAYYEHMEPKRNGYLFAFYNALCAFFNSDFDSSTVVKHVTDGINLLTTDFLCLPRDVITIEHYRVLNRIQRFVEIRESIDLSKALKLESSAGVRGVTSVASSISAISPQSTFLNAFNRTICNWRRREISVGDEYIEHDSIQAWRVHFLNHVAAQSQARRHANLSKSLRILADLRAIDLEGTLRKQSSFIHALNNLSAYKDRPETHSFQLISDCSNQIAECICDLSPYLNSPTDLLPGLEELEHEPGSGVYPRPIQLFNNSWVNNLPPEKVTDLMAEHEAIKQECGAVRSTDECLAGITADKVQVMIKDGQYSYDEVHSHYIRTLKVEARNVRVQFDYVSFLVDDVIRNSDQRIPDHEVLESRWNLRKWDNISQIRFLVLCNFPVQIYTNHWTNRSKSKDLIFTK
ncbi:hypothetical protein ACOME3_006220 [Neoechinorhynchus agilis]